MGKRSRKKKKPAKRQQAASPLPEDEPSQSPEPADPSVEAESALPDEVESEALPIESVNEPIPKPDGPKVLQEARAIAAAHQSGELTAGWCGP